MIPLVADRLKTLEELCARHHVARLHLFGSATGEDFRTEASDLDFLVELEPLPPTERARAFFGLLEDLERLFERRIDLLEAEPIQNPFLWKSIVATRQLIYGAA